MCYDHEETSMINSWKKTSYINISQYDTNTDRFHGTAKFPSQGPDGLCPDNREQRLQVWASSFRLATDSSTNVFSAPGIEMCEDDITNHLSSIRGRR
jgi:hypothetical protein